MAWLDDRIRDHPKIARLTPSAFREWVLSLCYCSAHGTRGNLDMAVVIMRTPKKLVRELVDAGLWEEHEDGLWVHDWGAHNERRDEKLAARRSFDTRRQQLMRDPDLRAAVRERDGDHCRYCGREVNWLDRKGVAGATYDHVDPNGENTLENLVVCCRSCNSIKRGRTIEEAGLRLRPAPTRSDAESSSGARSDLDPDLVRPRAPAQGPARPGAGARPNDHDHDQEDQEQTSAVDAAHATHEQHAIEEEDPDEPIVGGRRSLPPLDTVLRQIP